MIYRFAHLSKFKCSLCKIVHLSPRINKKPISLIIFAMLWTSEVFNIRVFWMYNRITIVAMAIVSHLVSDYNTFVPNAIIENLPPAGKNHKLIKLVINTGPPDLLNWLQISTCMTNFTNFSNMKNYAFKIN